MLVALLLSALHYFNYFTAMNSRNFNNNAVQKVLNVRLPVRNWGMGSVTSPRSSMDVDLETLVLMPMHTTTKLAYWEDK